MADNTKKTIAAAYKSILDEGGSQTITVKDVVERAGVSRMTFYYHFKDIYDLVDWVYRDYFKNLDSVVHASDAWRFLSETVVDMTENNRANFVDNYQHLDRGMLDKTFSKVLFDLVEQCVENDPECEKFDQGDRRFLTTLMTYCMTGLIDSWFDHDFEIDASDYIERFDRLVKQQIM